jgi:hypothetical protein
MFRRDKKAENTKGTNRDEPRIDAKHANGEGINNEDAKAQKGNILTEANEGKEGEGDF